MGWKHMGRGCRLEMLLCVSVGFAALLEMSSGA